jgi:SAM-dependent methyltransferase
VARFQAEGRFIATRALPRSEWNGVSDPSPVVSVLEHEAISFPSFPMEWSPAMLEAAGSLTLELATDLLSENRGLKDATPLNVLFRGSQPVFIDALSVEPRDPGDALWPAYGQFVRTFILPLVASRYLGQSLRRVFTGARDGLTPEEIYSALSWGQRLRKSIIGTVTGPVLLERMVRAPQELRLRRPKSAEMARFIMRAHLRRLQKTLHAVVPENKRSQWTSYRDASVHQPPYHAQRQAVVESILRSHGPSTVLDIGTNDGLFALIAARLGASVIAIDRDEAVIDRLFRSRERGSERVLPLVVDLADPTPATGWRNKERPSFLDRAKDGFDAVLALAVLHHLVIGDGLALDTVVDLIALLTRRVAIAEFVPASDPLCRRLAAGREINPERWSPEVFEGELAKRFSIASQHPVGANGRIVFELLARVG